MFFSGPLFNEEDNFSLYDGQINSGQECLHWTLPPRRTQTTSVKNQKCLKTYNITHYPRSTSFTKHISQNASVKQEYTMFSNCNDFNHNVFQIVNHNVSRLKWFECASKNYISSFHFYTYFPNEYNMFVKVLFNLGKEGTNGKSERIRIASRVGEQGRREEQRDSAEYGKRSI